MFCAVIGMYVCVRDFSSTCLSSSLDGMGRKQSFLQRVDGKNGNAPTGTTGQHSDFKAADAASAFSGSRSIGSKSQKGYS